jgi:hypothetical protein
MGPINSVYFLMEFPAQAKSILDLHEESQLDCMRQCAENGVAELVQWKQGI